MRNRPTPTFATDVEPLPTASHNAFPISTGLYGLPPLDTWQEPRSCLKDIGQSQAWSCKVPYVYYMMKVECIPDGTPTERYLLTLNPFNVSDSQFLYGTQPPNIPDPMKLSLVNDTYEPGKGPAWYLQMTYNKTVILSEETFSAPTKRGWHPDGPGGDFAHAHMKYKKKYGAVDGDKPWICSWPVTTLEVFIYPNQNASSQYASSATTQSSYSSYQSQYPSQSQSQSQSSSTTSSIADPAETYYPSFSPPPPYPKVIKMLERRSAESSQTAVCRQVEITDGGTQMQDVYSDGSPVEIVIQLEGDWSDQKEYNQRFKYSRSHTRWGARSLLDGNTCGCLWWST